MKSFEDRLAFLGRPHSVRNLFLASVVLFFVALFHTSFYPELTRNLPVEVDDSINSILRAVQVVECPQQDCRALESVRPDLIPAASDPQLLNLQWDKYTRLFAFHTPLHSFLLAGLHEIGIDWIDGFRILKFVGMLTLVAGTSFFLLSLFGHGPAALAVLLVASTYFVGHGYIWFAPSNISLAVAMAAWGAIIRYGRRAV